MLFFLYLLNKEDGFNETWTVVQDAARYSFNASHSLCVAIDSLYGAYLKSHYPLEYFSTVLSFYSEDTEKTAKLTDVSFSIESSSIKFFGFFLDTSKSSSAILALQYLTE